MAEVTKTGLLILWCLKQAGKTYRLGATVKLLEDDADNPYGFKDVREWDCAELVKGGFWAVGLREIYGHPLAEFDPAWRQFELSKHRKIPIDVARITPGALVFSQFNSSRPHNIGHVAIVVAKNTIVEARGKAYGVVVGPWRDSFTLATKIDPLYQK